jgi:hypothetical protein
MLVRRTLFLVPVPEVNLVLVPYVVNLVVKVYLVPVYLKL